MDAGTATPWALVDALDKDGDGAVGPFTTLATVPLVARQVRLAARRGFAGALVLVAPQQRQAALDALALAPPPAGFPVEVVHTEADAAGRPFRRLAAQAIYASADVGPHATAEPTPLCIIQAPQDVRVAVVRLQRADRKTVEEDGAVAYALMRPLARALGAAVAATSITPNQITVLAMVMGLAAAVVASFGGYLHGVVAGVLLWAGAVLDCADGELARLRLSTSRLGEWLDSVADEVSTYGLLFGISLGLAVDHAGIGIPFTVDPRWRVEWGEHAPAVWLTLGACGAVLGLGMQARLLYDLHRWRLPIDTSKYPWFFGPPAAGGVVRRGPIIQAMHLTGYLFRRDAVVTLVLLLLVLGLRPWVVVMLCGGAVTVVVMWLLSLWHLRGSEPVAARSS